MHQGCGCLESTRVVRVDAVTSLETWHSKNAGIYKKKNEGSLNLT